jgi:hypothetical protein
MDNVKFGINYLLRYPLQHNKYAIDKFWFYLQRLDRWFLIIPPTVIQKEGYSDIEKKQTNYNKVMTDIDKPYLQYAKLKIE